MVADAPSGAPRFYMGISPVTESRGRRRRGNYPLPQSARLLLLAACLYTGAAGAEISNAVVFMYHRFGETAYASTNVQLGQFDAHLQHLAAEHYQIWPLQRIVEHLQKGQAIPDRTVAITVDDAYLSVYTQAYPRLKRRGWPFTVFVSTDAVDQHLPAFMSWAQMREMQRDGVVFANHSSSHDYLIRHKPGESRTAWRERVAADIARAQRRLTEELGEPPMLFAYPYGEYDGALADLVKELGFVAFGQHSGAIGPWSDLRALPRYPMAEAFADLAEFRAKAASLALPVREVEPWDPVISGETPPLMKATLAPSDARLSALSCFDNHGDKIEVNWIRQDSGNTTGTAVFTARARQALPKGRSRYNCTAPSAQANRYYWFSHPWIQLGIQLGIRPGIRPDADASMPSAGRSRASPRPAPP